MSEERPFEFFTRFLKLDDADSVFQCYRETASHPRGFARSEEEISAEYVTKELEYALQGGVAFAAIARGTSDVIGFIWAQKLGPRAFDHVLSELTIGVLPGHQRKGIGRRLFLDFIEHVQTQRADILRVELIVRESNLPAIAFYESIGFRREGLFENRIRNADGTFEADVPMGWLKTGF